MNKIRNWPTRALYGFVALAMVLSLVLMGGVAPTVGTAEPVAAQSPEVGLSEIIAVRGSEAGPNVTELLVYIERPTSGASFNVSDTFYVNAVVAYKDIEENDDASKLVTATIDPGPNAELWGDDIGQESKSATINRNCVGDFWWKLHCNGEGETTINVTAVASGLPDGQDSVTVTQGTPDPECALTINIIEPDSDLYVDPCQNFVVKATLTNDTASTIENVVATIDISDPDLASLVGDPESRTVGNILPGDSQEVGWNLHCDAVGDVVITVDATADGVSASGICEDWVTVYQGEEEPEPETGCFNVTVSAPDEVCTQGCGYNSYNVSATIENTCSSNCTNVKATISKIVGSSKASIDPPLEQDIGPLGPSDSATVTWNVTCTGLGDVTFKVVAEGDEDACLGEGTDTVEQKRILIDLIEPESGDLIQHNICQTFNVTANITNCDCFGLGNVTVQLDLPDSVCITGNTTIHITHYDEELEYVDDYYIDPADLDDPEKIPFPSFCMCCVYTVEWINLHCCDETPDYGDTAEEVYIKVWDGDENLMDEDYFLVKQTEKAHLAAGVEAYLGTSGADGPTDCNMSTTPATAVAVNQSFVVVVPVINMGMADAEDVSVNVTIDGEASCAGNHTFDLGTIPGRTAKKVFITCNCTGDENVEITISALSGTDAVKKVAHPYEEDLWPIPEDNIYPCGEKTLSQIPVTIEIIQPADEDEFDCSDRFNVKVKVTNGASDPDEDLESVTATVSWTGPGSAETDDPTERDLGNIPGGSWAEATWNFHCTSTGDVTFRVDIESETPAWTDYRTVTISQAVNAVLDVEILSPMDGSEYRTSEEFAVTAEVTVESADLGFVEGVSVQIYDNCDALDYLGSTSIPLGTMEEGDSQIVSWTVHAEEAGTQCDSESCPITVSANAPCAQSDYHQKTVKLYPAANLLVEITDYPEEDIVVCSTFNVTARVTNIGWADATGVKLLLSVIPDGSVRPVKGDNSYEKDVGTLLGYGTGDYAEVTWTLHCKEACESTITIEPFGYDECGWYWVNTGESGSYYQQPNRAIEEKFLHDDSVTVKQVEPAQLVMDITYPADGAEFQEGDTFVVSGKVSNIGETTATDVTATLTVDPETSATITGAAKDLDTIAGGQTEVVSWAVECESAGFSVFTATAEATNADDALDTVTVKQGAAAAAQLVVDITYPSDGAEFYGGDEPDDFVVTAKITNIGEQEATSVNATIDIRDGDPAELVTPPAASQIIASIPAGESKVVSWNLLAGNATGSAVITVTAVGPNTALDAVTVKIDPAPVQALFEGANPIAYQGKTEYLPEALTNITDQLVIIWQRDATTDGDWHRFYFYSGNPMGEIDELVENSAYIVVVSENCGWNLVH